MRTVALLLLPVCMYVSAAQAPQPNNADASSATQLKRDFTLFDPQYASDTQSRVTRLLALKAKVVAQEAAGVRNDCAHQILFEAGTLLITTADFKRIDRRADELAVAIAHPSQDKQDADGMWGSCSEQWFLKLENTYDHLRSEEHSLPDGPARPLPAFLARVATPDKLTAWLNAIAVSDVQHTGIDHGLEFNLTNSDLVRMLILGEPNYKIDPALRDAYLKYLLGPARNHQTGMWGERYRRDGHVDYVDDISTSFHIISYLEGKVPEMDRVVDTLLAVKDRDSPAGWLQFGQYWNHNNVDVVTVFQYGWLTASPEQRKAMAAEIDRMLTWCLHDSLQPDGSFKVTAGDPSLEYAEQFGVEFLGNIGFFTPKHRFWTDRTFPESADVRKRIEGFIAQHKDSDPDSDEYRKMLEDIDGK
jgi:hypothetical protein